MFVAGASLEANASLVGVGWLEVPATRRSSAAQQIANLINHSLIEDGLITGTEWGEYEAGVRKSTSIVSTEDVDGFYRGTTVLAPQAARYARLAAQQNGIYLSVNDHSDRWVRLFVYVSSVFFVAGSVEFFTPIAFFDQWSQDRVFVGFFVVALLMVLVAVMVEVSHGRTEE